LGGSPKVRKVGKSGRNLLGLTPPLCSNPAHIFNPTSISLFNSLFTPDQISKVLFFQLSDFPDFRTSLLPPNINSTFLLIINIFKINIMKNTLKITLLALAVSFSVAACNGNKTGSSTDSAKVDSSSSSVKSTTDTTVKVDTAKAMDTSKMDTTNKSTTKKTVVKKTVVKKD